MRIAKRILLLGVFVCGAAVASSAWADTELPKPLTGGGTGIFELLERRASGTRNKFPTGEVSLEELATILWAATGRNRGGSGWTIPTAGGLPPYALVYVVKKDGVFLYDRDKHALKEISKKNAMGDITNDNFVKSASAVLVLVSDTSNMGSMGRLNVKDSLASNIAGAMSQNVYLAADALGIATRYMVSMNTDGVNRELKLSDASPICILPLAKR
ncbi:MAG: nitroreductase family protein [Synergistaceae bacterium]|jgi:nitroreductase|nr:nitroreductase family protein [Synergistaceae bacterium]